MFPTDSLLERLALAKARLSGNAPNIDNHDESLRELIDGLIEYFEYKKKPFMDSMQESRGKITDK